MASRKKSTSTESSTDSSSNSSSSSGSSSGSDSGSTSSDSDSSSSQGEKTARSSSRSNELDAATQPAQKSITTSEKDPPRRSSESKQSSIIGPSKTDDKIGLAPQKNKTSVNRGQRLSKSSICSSDDDSTVSKKQPKKNASQIDRKRITEARKIIQPPLQPPFQPPINGGGKAPPSVVKLHHSLAKNAQNQQGNLKVLTKQQQQQKQDRTKKKSIFSPDNSSFSEDDDVKKTIDKTSVIKAKQVPKDKTAKQPPQRKIISSTAKKKEDIKNSGSSSSCSSDGSTSSSGSDDSDSSDDDSSPPLKKPLPRKMHQKGPATNDNVKTVILSDSESEQSKQPRVRKLTRSASTRKSKHLTGKASDTDSDIDTDKRSLSKSPVKKAPIIATKSKAKTKKEVKTTIPPCLATPPIPEEQKCPVEGCDSSGHLSGNLDKHFLPEACPIYHNMSASETKERANERTLHEEERKKTIAMYDPTKKFITPEQKAYQMKIRESRAKFKPASPSTPNEKCNKIEKVTRDREREPNLNGLVPDYDLQLFREAQALASEKMEKELKDLPVGKGIKYITMGKYQMKVWYQSPYPEEAARQPKMYICEFCLRYQKSEVGMKRHAAKCVWRHPPGDEIYRKGKLQVWQVDGKRHKQYCQHLCLLAKFFLDHKTLYHDVEPFLFYVMTLADSEGCHTVGYFSKEKNSFLNYNVSCILTLPPYQRKGYGRLLIDFSYLLTRVEGKIGSPEKPLSDLGLISYRSYWKDVLLDYLCTRTGTTLSIKDVSQEMAIYSYDIVSTLQALGMMKYWKGKHIILKKQDVLEEFEERVKRRGNFPKIDPACLRWSPFVPPQSAGSS